MRRRTFTINGSSISLDIFFQPIVNLGSKRCLGFEALVRGVDSCTGEIISPNVLFRQAKKNGTLVEFDRCCKELSIRKFVDYGLHKSYTLFLNIEHQVIDQGKAGTTWIKKKLKHYGVDPEMIVAEIKEGQINNLDNLMKFVARYRSYGIHIALDDFGSQNSNLDRLLTLEPCFIKIDRAFVQEPEKNDKKYALIEMYEYISRKFGCVPIAEGVETLNAVRKIFQAGIIIFQGFFFAKPDPDPIVARELAETKIDEVLANGEDSLHLHGEFSKEPDCRGVCQALCKVI